MKAAVLKDVQSLGLCELAIPTISEAEALIRVRYGGVCGSDMTVYRGQHPTATLPVVPCHEILGTIEALPNSYHGDFQVGDRVVMNPVLPCGSCPPCKAGRYNVCDNLKLLGIHVNGGFSEYTKVPISNLIPVDPKVTDEIAALGEPVAVSYHVCNRAGIQKGDRVLVFGAGTIGLLVALMARELGGDVVVSEINADRIHLAQQFGFLTINPVECDLLTRCAELTQSTGFDVVCDATGSKVTALQLPDVCTAGGRILSLGLSSAKYEFILGKISFKEETIIGSRLYTQEHFRNGISALKTLSKKYDLSLLISDIMPLSEIDAAYSKMLSGKNLGKILIDCRK